jgi:hypothetical protein
MGAQETTAPELYPERPDKGEIPIPSATQSM